jgi:hypothetical protein
MNEPKEIRITITKPSAPIINLPSIEVKTLFFCTHCQSSFQEQNEWQEHEDEEHERQYYYSCPESKCDKIFTDQALFNKHHTEDHECTECEHAVEIRRPLPSKRSWGCGFDRCKSFFNDWQTRCDHVAEHFESLASEEDTSSQPVTWKYTNMIRNLLRQPDVKEAYQKALSKAHGNDKSFWPKLRWEAGNTVEMKRRLEYRDFRGGVRELALMACQLGRPAAAQATVKIVMDPAAPDAPAHSPPPASPVVQNTNFLHIDKFPVPGQNPFDLYGPVPPSPIIQLDFVSDPAVEPEPEIKHTSIPPSHSSRTSVSQTAAQFSLYPSPSTIEREPLAPVLPPLSTHHYSSSHHTSLQSINITPSLSELERPSPATSLPTVSTLASPVGSISEPREFPLRTTSKHWAVLPATSPVQEYPTSGYPTSGSPLHSGATSPISPSSPSRPKTPKSIFRSATSLMRKRSGNLGVQPVPLQISQPFDAEGAARRIQEYHAL